MPGRFATNIRLISHISAVRVLQCGDTDDVGRQTNNSTYCQWSAGQQRNATISD